MRRATRWIALVAISSLSLALLAAAPPATADDPPTLRVFTAQTSMDATLSRNGRVWLDPGAWLAAVGGAFELRIGRTDYTSPVTASQTDAVTGEVLRTLPIELFDGPWYGMRDFLHVSVRDPNGRLVTRQSVTVCPNGWYRARLNDDGPLTSRYPVYCGGMPLTRGVVWGIDEGWAVNPLSDYGLTFRAERGRHDVRIWIDPAWVEALGIAPDDAEARLVLEVRERDGRNAAPAATTPTETMTPGPRVPTLSEAPEGTASDLLALPAWGIGTYHRRGRDYLAFNATEWNAGPGTLVVEGFRGVDDDFMDAYQYFLQDGVAIGRAPIGQLEFHAVHGHWHFEEFTRYTLLDAATSEVQISGKQSWCLANTDAIDLSVPNANWGAAWSGDIFSSCGGPGALWIREVLDVGWGDTYSQYVPGQAFDITDLPNGEYYIRVHVNPTGSIFETSDANNIEDRLVIIRGKPGSRRVSVPPWNGIDTEDRGRF